MKIQITGVAPAPKPTLADVPLGRFARAALQSGSSPDSILLRLPHHFLVIEQGLDIPYVQTASAIASIPAEIFPEDFYITLGGK